MRWQIWDWHPVHIIVDVQLDFAGVAQNFVYAQNYTSRKYCLTDKNLLLSRNSMLTQIQQMSKKIVWKHSKLVLQIKYTHMSRKITALCQFISNA